MPFQCIGFDLVSELPRCDGDCYILHIVCWASGFNYIACIPDKKASTVAAELHKYFLLFGQPTDAIVTDNGREFVNAAFDELTEKWGCRTIRTSPYHPKGNSRTERRHRDSNTILRTAVNRYGETWKVGAYLANWALNVRPRTGSTHSPYELLLGFKPSVPGEKSVEELDGLKLHRATLSDPELLKNLDLHRCWALDNNAALQKECALNSKLRADEARYSITYSPGDLVNVTRPRIGKRSKGTATRLMYQQVGPFEVVRHLGNNAYRLRKLGTEHVSTHNVQHLHPYLTKEAYEKKIVTPALEEAAKAPNPPLQTAYVPKAGDHLLYTGFATKDKPFFLVKVESYDDRTGEVTFQFYNNGTSSGILTGHRLCWTTPPGEEGDEIQSMRRPANVCYEPFRETDTLDKFCLHPMPIKRLSASVRLAQKDVTHAMRLKRLPTLAIAMASLGGRGARRHPGMAAIAMVATMARAVSASAVNSVSRSWTPAEYSWDTRQLEMHQAVYSLRLGHSHEQQDSAASTYMVILSAIICITLLAIAMVWNGDDDRDEYDARRAHEAQREEVLAQIRDHDNHDLNHAVDAEFNLRLYRLDPGAPRQIQAALEDMQAQGLTSRVENHETWDTSFLHVPTPVADVGLGELFPTFIDTTDAGYDEEGLQQSYDARIRAIARAGSVSSWASLAANVAAEHARMSFLMTIQRYPKAYKACIEAETQADDKIRQLMSNLHVSTQLQQPLTPVEYYQRQHGVLVESCSVFDAKVTKPEGDYFRKKYPGIAIVRALVHPIPYDCPVLCGYWVLNAANDEVLEYVPPEISELGPAYKFLPLLPPQSPAQHEHLAQYLKWRRENYPDGRPPIWIEEDHPCPQIRAWRAANPDVQLTIRIATTQAPVPLPEWYRALV